LIRPRCDRGAGRSRSLNPSAGENPSISNKSILIFYFLNHITIFTLTPLWVSWYIFECDYLARFRQDTESRACRIQTFLAARPPSEGDRVVTPQKR
jgi:hypothetical protein